MQAPSGQAAGPILIVDDMPENLEVLGGLLRGLGHPVRVANSGETALRYAALAPHPELILLDIMMPGMDGYEVLRRLRANPLTRDIPVLFLTALNQVEDVVAGLRLGAVDYISKPAPGEIVLARVRAQLEAKRLRDQLRDHNARLEAEVARRVAEARQIQEEADRLQARLDHQRELILAATSDGILGIDPAGTINFCNPAAAALLGAPRDALLGRPLQALLPGTEGVTGPLGDSCLAGVEVLDREVVWHTRDGGEQVLELSCRPILESGLQAGAVLTLRDRSEARRYQEQLERKSNHDDLTGLPNRNLLHDRLNQAMARWREGGALAVIALNLDRFRDINQGLGREAGDEVLRETARRLGHRLSASDTLARLDGDEFVVIGEIQAGEAADAAGRLAQTLLAELARPYRLDEHEFVLGGSGGIALYPRDGEDGATLLRNATSAMYRAKAGGGRRLNFYAAAMHSRSIERLDLEQALRLAIEREELVLHYQPQLSLRSGAVLGAEALVRWQHPQRGLLSPAEFIGLAEDSGLIVPLGAWVLHAACRQNRAWQAAGLPPVTVAVNMSAGQLAAQDMVRLVAQVLDDTGLSPLHLELELTESLAMADAEAFIHTTRRFHDLGVHLSIDDFGTGFSSLSYLKRFAIDRLKIDQSFVRDVAHDANSAAIAQAVISLAHSLNLSVIAEGVESEAQLAFMRRRDCDEMQGYFFSRPLPAEAFAELLRAGRRLDLPAGADALDRVLLLVDDEPGILAALRRLFRREGYTVLTAHNGSAALDILATREVGVVLSDGRMPGMDGGEFLSQARKLYPDVVRIMLTGYTDLEALTRAVNSGELFGFLTKPWDEAQLLGKVRDAFRHGESRHRPAGKTRP